jgi:HSP20 family protein
MPNILRKIAGMEKADDEMPEENIFDEVSEDNDDTEEAWPEASYEEGQLSIDVYQTTDSIVVKSTIAGVSSDDIDISINNDMLTIRGKREQPDKVRDEDYLYRECYWGPFSRSIILPVEVEAERVEAFLENGVLTIKLPKTKTSKQISIKVKNK